MITFGSVCSGIEAASVAWHPLGFKAKWLSEIELFPSAVLEHHYPDVPNLGDMTKLSAMVKTKLIEAPDILVGGTPCQAFSIAGLRDSLEDDRGQLTLEFVRLANAIDTRRLLDRKHESIIVWENVPGVLNTKDNAFGNFIGALCGEDKELQPPGKRWTNSGIVSGPQRKVAWRVLDAQYFGVAQRRKRVFVVASARDDIDPAEILFESEGVRRDIAPSREAWKEVAGNVGEGFTPSSHWDGSGLVATRGYRMQAFGVYADDETASTCKARDYKDATDLVTYCADISLTVTNGPPFSRTGNERVEAEALVTYGIPGNWIGRKPENGGNATEPMVNVAPCQTRTDRHAVCIPINTMTCQGRPSDDLKPRMGLGIGKETDPQNTLTKAHSHAVGTTSGVRRLMPIECERLQGFPDNYTPIPWNGKPEEECPDGQRYKALGNSMAVPVMRWIGERIKNATQKEMAIVNDR